MTEVPKIVHQRLAAASQQAGPHPEADALAAFAEQRLLQAEREAVLQHLALCGECREVVSLALPEAETVLANEPVVEPVRARDSVSASRNWFAWTNLRWASLAAGIAVAVFVVRPALEHGGKQNPVVGSVVNQPAPAPAPVPTAPVAADKTMQHYADNRAGDAANSQNNLLSKSVATKQRISNQIAPQSPQAGMLVAGNLKKDSGRLDTLQASPAPAARSFDMPKSANEVVEADAAAVSGGSAGKDLTLMARAEAPPVVKSKPARDEAANEVPAAASAMPDAKSARVTSLPLNGRDVAQLASIERPAPIWRVSAGALQRSFDGGKTWESAAKASSALLCSANRGQEVWAGGQAGALLHSSDGGATWIVVQASFQDHALKADITGIELRDLAGIVLSTSDQQTWISADNGKTWEKK